MAERISSGMLSHGTLNVSGHILGFLDGTPLLFGLLNSDDDVDGKFDGLDSGEVPSSGDGLESGVELCITMRSKVIISVSKTKENTLVNDC